MLCSNDWPLNAPHTLPAVWFHALNWTCYHNFLLFSLLIFSLYEIQSDSDVSVRYLCVEAPSCTCVSRLKTSSAFSGQLLRGVWLVAWWNSTPVSRCLYPPRKAFCWRGRSISTTTSWNTPSSKIRESDSSRLKSSGPKLLSYNHNLKKQPSLPAVLK